MAFFNKRMILLFTNLFLLAGIGTTIANYSTSVIQGEAASSRTLTLNRSIYSIIGADPTTSYFDYSWSKTDSNGYNISGQGSFPGSSDATTYLQIRQNVTTAQPGTLGNNYRGFWNTSALPGFITKIVITPLASSNPLTSVARSIAPILSANALIGPITSFASAATVAPSHAEKESAQNVMGSSTVVTPVEWNFSASKMYTFFNITPNSNHTHYYTSVEITFSVMDNDSEVTNTFANYFLSYTENKTSNCTINGLNWTNLTSTYNTLTTNQKSLFVQGSPDSTIASAVSRYIYLRQFNNELNNFADL